MQNIEAVAHGAFSCIQGTGSLVTSLDGVQDLMTFGDGDGYAKKVMKRDMIETNGKVLDFYDMVCTILNYLRGKTSAWETQCDLIKMGICVSPDDFRKNLRLDDIIQKLENGQEVLTLDLQKQKEFYAVQLTELNGRFGLHAMSDRIQKLDDEKADLEKDLEDHEQRVFQAKVTLRDTERDLVVAENQLHTNQLSHLPKQYGLSHLRKLRDQKKYELSHLRKLRNQKKSEIAAKLEEKRGLCSQIEEKLKQAGVVSIHHFDQLVAAVSAKRKENSKLHACQREFGIMMIQMIKNYNLQVDVLADKNFEERKRVMETIMKDPQGWGAISAPLGFCAKTGDQLMDVIQNPEKYEEAPALFLATRHATQILDHEPSPLPAAAPAPSPAGDVDMLREFGLVFYYWLCRLIKMAACGGG